MKEGPLSRLLVLDASRALAGPFCTMLLGDMGARVIKVEHPSTGDPARSWGPPFVKGESTYFLSVNRNKKSITLDFQTEQGKALLQQLARKADVFVENFKTGSLERLGLDYESLRSVNPGLIYCSISGYGRTGPRKYDPGFDITIQAESGIMAVTGDPEGPPTKAGVSITDIFAGLYAANGIALALLVKQKTGEGQLVDIGLFDCALSMLTFQASNVLAGAAEPTRMGNYHPSLAPYESFAASDGYFTVGVGNDEMWNRFCNALLPYGFQSNHRFSSNAERVESREDLHRMLQRIFEKRRISEWFTLFREVNVPCGRVNSVKEALSEEQSLSREMVLEVFHRTLGPLRQVGIPIKLSETPGSLGSPPPLLGEHNDQVFSQLLGLPESEIENLRSKGII
jgi:crotonobetainyl-CoA:carnitine CoA-transferase CaiB-like acyl-CoA transferase